MRRFIGVRLAICVGFVLVALGLAGWLGRVQLQSRYFLYRLAHASDTPRLDWAKHIADLDDAGMAGVLELLRSPQPRASLGARAALDCLAERWQSPDLRVRLSHELADKFACFSLPGQRQALEAASMWLGTGNWPPEAIDALAVLLVPAGHSPDRETRAQALVLERAMVGHGGPAATAACRELVRVALTDQVSEIRASAACSAAAAELDLLAEVAPLLDDPAPDVRQAALVTLGPPEAAAVVTTDDLLRSLHDPDRDVRRLCEAALRSRSLSDQDILLGRLVTSPEPTTRLQVLEKLRRASDQEPGVWLRRLSRDPSPAVRGAAIRASLDYANLEMTERIAQMARTDPSETVRQLAEHYLSARQTLPLPAPGH
jgi:hypothetical protein